MEQSDLQRTMAERLADMLGEPVRCGRYVDVADSLHIYGSYRTPKLVAEVTRMKETHYSERAWDSAVFEEMFEEARQNLAKNPDYYAQGDSRSQR